MKVVFFVAAGSNSGKTTLIEKVVRLLKAREHRVAVIKHTSKGFDLGDPDLEDWLRSGAESVMVVGDCKVTTIKKIDDLPPTEEMRKTVGEVDFMIYEGFKADARNKIEVFRYGISGNRPRCMDDPSYIALVSDGRYDIAIPQFDLNDAESITNFISGR